MCKVCTIYVISMYDICVKYICCVIIIYLLCFKISYLTHISGLQTSLHFFINEPAFV